VASGRVGWTEDGDCFPIVPSIDAEICLVHGDHRMVGKQFAEADQAQIGKIRVAVPISLGQLREALLVFGHFESDAQHPVLDERENEGNGTKMEGRLRQHRFACQERFRNALGDVHRPGMKTVGAIAKSHDQAGVSNGLHDRANPLREERSGGPLILPA
jgi:hypothetical protein